MKPYLTVVIPTLNEEHHIERCVRSLLEDRYPREMLEILIIDGGSSDGTVEIAQGLTELHPNLRVLMNPDRIQAAAFAVAMSSADVRSTCLLRCDAHAIYPSGFITGAVGSLDRTGAGMVGFSAVPTAEAPFQRAVAFAESTPIGVGGSAYRSGGRSGWVDSAMHGCFFREVLEDLGGYDESFSHNEDAELSLRLREAGYGVWFESDLEVGYFPRSSIGALARQYFNYGRGRARTCRKHRIIPKPRQLAPIGLVLVNTAAILRALTRPRSVAPVLAYSGTLVFVAVRAALNWRDPALNLSAFALATMHHTWAAGFLLETCLSARRPDRTEQSVRDGHDRRDRGSEE